ncbi:VPA1269 family protein [Acinetobacter sp. YH12039]|uniref:gamma-mobile-trio integrase GmtZ n=1 Tax=Acinetobacter sp. YH12039 TaxID=2601047 RepID=UPI0015D40567|nr:VPA1269 family protein [Acinetobacter sp. YH12039]
MAKITTVKRKKYDGRKSDLTLLWLVKNHGKEWEIWRQLAEEWITKQDEGTAEKLDALCIFFDIYLAHTMPFTSNVLNFFTGKNGWKASTDEFKRILLISTNKSDNKNTAKLINYTKLFIDWVLDTHFSQKDDNGNSLRLYVNPFTKVKSRFHNTETMHNPLPYRYICDLRNILCPQSRGSFSDWLWAQQQTGQGITQSGHWFEVDKSLIDKNDKDCVWRTKKVTRKGRITTIHQIWSPVASMLLFIKLHLPLRTYQVRMLDSGEADTMRYENGNWVKNSHTFALNSYSKGVFRQFKDNATGTESTGLYISTNKTADQNKEEFERGYEIPWQHEDVLYWLEKLRNWQEKYNPIYKSVDCTTLEGKHTSRIKSKTSLSAMGHSCFLFRDASAKLKDDKTKPIIETPILTLWYKLLQQLEKNLLVTGETLSDGTKLRLVHDYKLDHHKTKTKTEFPLHSLRVSLITSYIIDAKLPIPVVSKLLAGHSRIIMTVYYTKLTPVVMKDKMTEAERLLDSKSQDNLRLFLKDAEMRQIKCKTAYQNDKAIEVALVNRNPLGWENRHHGLCLVGGNTVRSDECKSVAGCWNGGILLKDSAHPSSRIYDSVPHGLENCVRCRWFITDARYLPALCAHLNFMSYKAHEAANLAVNLENEIEVMEELKYKAENESKLFTQHNELQAFRRRYEKQLVEADEYTKDWIATFKLIRRLIEIEQARAEMDTSNKLIAVGSENDIKVGFIETNSELLQLSLLCEDAEFYPDILDDIKKTPAIQNRTQNLSRLMMCKGYSPQLLMLDQEQQLISANAMMRQMALQANPTNKLDGYTQVTNYLELGHFMQDSKLLDAGMEILKNNINQPILKLTPHGLKPKDMS